MTGPDTQYVGQPATYSVEVANNGDAPAPGTTLTVRPDPKARFVRAGGDRGEAAKQGADGVLTWDLGTLPPGGSRRLSLTVTGREKGKVTHQAVARFACDRARDDESLALARESAATEMLVVPALRLSLVDQTDLIRKGETVTYTLRVVNQGTGPDRDLKPTVELPDGLEFVDASGPTQASADGRTVTLGAVRQLDAGKSVTWNVRARAAKAGDVRTTATLNSEYLDGPVETTEPTRLIE